MTVPVDVWTFIQSAGVPGVLFLIIGGVLRRWWVPGWLYDDVCRERDLWKAAAMSGIEAAEVLSKETVVPHASGRRRGQD